MGGVREDVGGGLIDRDRPGAGGRVGVLLSGVELESLKVIGGVLGHGKHPFCIWEVGGRGEINPAPEYVGQYTIENQLSQWVIEKKSVPPIRAARFSLSKNLCLDESARVLAGELEGAAARLEWDQMP